MKKNISNIAGNLEELASLDFLDLYPLGETGTGKTHTGKLIHDLSPRSGRPMVSVNCAELSPSLIESELLGHEKGGGTRGGSVFKRRQVQGGERRYLFLDEVGELETTLQAKLLKVVEEKCVTRVGGNRPRPVDVRVVYATHRDLSVFREDIPYRVTSHLIEGGVFVVHFCVCWCKNKPLLVQKRTILNRTYQRFKTESGPSNVLFSVN